MQVSGVDLMSHCRCVSTLGEGHTDACVVSLAMSPACRSTRLEGSDEPIQLITWELAVTLLLSLCAYIISHDPRSPPVAVRGWVAPMISWSMSPTLRTAQADPLLFTRIRVHAPLPHWSTMPVPPARHGEGPLGGRQGSTARRCARTTQPCPCPCPCSYACTRPSYTSTYTRRTRSAWTGRRCDRRVREGVPVIWRRRAGRRFKRH